MAVVLLREELWSPSVVIFILSFLVIMITKTGKPSINILCF